MSEEIDLELTGIYNAMDEGLVILAEEKRKEEDQNLDYEKQLKTLEKESFAFLPEILRPFSKLQDMDTYIDEKGCFKPEFIWWLVEIPDLAMMGVFWNSTSENNLKYVVFKPEFNENPGNPFKHTDEWNKIIVYRDITNHKIALARAYQVMKDHMQRQHGKIPEMAVGSNEPEYVPFEQDLIDSNGQFDTPLAAFFSTHMLNELVRFINFQIIQQRESQVKE
jgi:hypothetical protein